MKTVINIKTDKEIKKDAQKIARDLGFSLSAIINAYLRQFIRNKEVHFGATSRMSLGLEKLLGGVEADICKNRNLSKLISSPEELKSFFSSL